MNRGQTFKPNPAPHDLRARIVERLLPFVLAKMLGCDGDEVDRGMRVRVGLGRRRSRVEALEREKRGVMVMVGVGVVVLKAQLEAMAMMSG